MLNWIVWNRTDYLYKNGLGLSNLPMLICNKPTSQRLYVKIPVSFCRKDSGLCLYYLVVWSKVNLLQKSQSITFSTKLCRVLFFVIYRFVFFFASTKLSILLCLMDFCFNEIMTLFSILISRDSVSLFRFPFLTSLHIFSSAILTLEIAWQLSFFLILFLHICCFSACIFVANAVICCCN